METEEKVFISNISKTDYKENNCLYDLLTVEPAIPLPEDKSSNVICEFTPKADKYYIPKKSSKFKVKTVRDIRKTYEEDVYSYLIDDLEKQKSSLLRKIRDGTSKTESTRLFAKKILDADYPISRSAWQMLVNINPEGHSNPKQFVIWKNKLIQVNGSKGGKRGTIFNYDLEANILSSRKTSRYKQLKSKIQKHLLKNSLEVKFKPGPLSKKRFLDNSYQKHLGNIELINLPSPVLQVHPTYGTVLDPSIANFLSHFRDVDGCMTKNWVEFAVSVLGKLDNNSISQTDNDSSVSFTLSYVCDKKRILMRRDGEDVKPGSIQTNEYLENNFSDSDIKLEVQNVVEGLLNAVEISLLQDSLYSTDDDTELIELSDTTNMNIAKDKIKKKFTELDRLDVTVIKLPETEASQMNIYKPCDKSFCILGCVCDSLNSTINLRTHCGLLACMFHCKCEIPKYKGIEQLQIANSDIIPGLMNLDSTITSRLAKEEQKFHQTVIVTGEKSIVLKNQKRNRKSTKRYANFCSEAGKNIEQKRKKLLTIIETKINCENIEPWCMVHNLYRCFCKGKFTESSVTIGSVPEAEENPISPPEETNIIMEDPVTDTDYSCRLRTRNQSKRKLSRVESKDISNIVSDFSSSESEITTCARTEVYQGRKYTDGYYKHTHSKILEMEKNDKLLKKKMSKLVNNVSSENSDPKDVSVDLISNDSASNDSDTNLNENQPADIEPFKHKDLVFAGPTDKKNKLVSWLEKSYKVFKKRVDSGNLKMTLNAPVKGRMALHPWEFILSRYRERKNVFMVSREKPFRIFVAVNDKSSLFNNCINIDDIRFAELNKYPLIVKNLLTNATDLKNNFCILGGWDDCWEIVGSVTKLISEDVTASNEDESSTNIVNTEDNDSPPMSFLDEKETNFEATEVPTTSSSIEPKTDNIERSKWFLMTLENDFTEIQFYKKGFYVKHASILQAIELARVSGKTVRLSSQTCNEKNSDPQFGIYAIPNTSQFCVFVGPYEIHESLGIEIVKNILDTRKYKKTRGVWIVTNKVDDMQVINNPLSFIPTKTEQSGMMLSLGSNYKVTNAPAFNTESVAPNVSAETQGAKEESSEIIRGDAPVIKPIKIQRKNGFYQLLNVSKNLNNPSIKSLIRPVKNSIVTQKILVVRPTSTNTSSNIKPVAEIAPQIKLTSRKNIKDSESPNKRKGMFILKPEEINKRVLESSQQKESEAESEKSESIQMTMDIENFLVNSTIRTIPDDEILVLSDDDVELVDKNINKYQMVWIQSNIEKFGWIRGRKNNENMISFEFPGFKYSEFYTESEAINKINQVLSRKIYVPKKLNLEWKIIENINEVKGDILTNENLKENCILTKHGIEDVNTYKERIYAKEKIDASSSKGIDTPIKNKSLHLKLLEEESEILEHESNIIWNKTVSQETDIMKSLRLTDERRSEMTDALNMIIELNDDDE